MGVQLGQRISTSAAATAQQQPGAAEGRRYGFVVGREPGGERRWLVRFDDRAQPRACGRAHKPLPVAAAALTPEVLDDVQGMPSFNPGTLPADELHEARFLPEPPGRVEQIFEYDRQRFNFRRWFVEDIVAPAAALTLPSPLTALTLPAECRAPGPAGAAPEPEPEPGPEPSVGENQRDGTARLLSNLHRTPTAGQRALEVGAIPGPSQPLAVAATGIAIPPTALEAAAAAGVKASHEQNRVRPSHTVFHRIYGNTMRATVKNDGAEVAARRKRFEVLLRQFVREVVAPRIGCGDRPDDVSYQASPVRTHTAPVATRFPGMSLTDCSWFHRLCGSRTLAASRWATRTAIMNTTTSRAS